MMRKLETLLERGIFAARWLMAPFYIGLCLALLLPLMKFLQELYHTLDGFWGLHETQVILSLLTLVDLALIANLVIMVIFAGYENFVSKMDIGRHEDRPEWMGKVDFSGLKLKLISSIVAISGIHVLKAFMSAEDHPPEKLWLLVGIHMAFVVSGVLLATMDYIMEKAHQVKESHRAHFHSDD